MDKHGEFFPEQPENVDELIDALARRQAAAERMMASLSPEQREQLAQLMSQALADADLASEMAQLSDNLRALRPGLDRGGPVRMRRRRAARLQRRPSRRSPSWPTSRRWSSQLVQAAPGSTLDDVDVDMLERQLGAEAVADLAALRELERELERQGYRHRTATTGCG